MKAFLSGGLRISRLLAVLLLSTAHAGDPPMQGPRATVARTTLVPRIDDVLEPAVWSGAPTIARLPQVEPKSGAEASELTEVRILCDSDTLYIGVRCFDSEPLKIIATQPSRDAELDPDDRFEMVLDTFLATRAKACRPSAVGAHFVARQERLVRQERPPQGPHPPPECYRDGMIRSLEVLSVAYPIHTHGSQWRRILRAGAVRGRDSRRGSCAVGNRHDPRAARSRARRVLADRRHHADSQDALRPLAFWRRGAGVDERSTDRLPTPRLRSTSG